MAAPATPFLLMLLVLIGGGLALLPTSSVAADMPMPVNEEVLGLVVFKSALTDPSGKLASWTESDATPCGWPCVECDPSTSRVLRLALDGLSLSGPMPRGLDRLTALQDLSLARNNLSGPLPPGLSLLKSLRSLDLSHNAFSGPLPDDLSMLGSLRYLDLTANAFSGPLPDLPSSLRFLMLSDNQFAGPLPKGLAAQSALLLHLNVSGNQLTGSPDFSGALWTLSRLRALDMSRNQFAGPVPDGVARLHNLKTLDLSGNRFFGGVPRDLGLCPHLAAVDLSNNAFDGHLPDSIAQLSSLVRFSASGNRLSGDVPAWLGKLTALQRLDLSGNAFTGSLPESIGDLKALSYLGLSDNQLSGSVPDSILSGGCSRLVELHLRGNNLTGTIVIPAPDVASYPETLLQWLDLSGNRLTGGIPAGMLASSKMMRYVNLSHNDLRAQLPPEMGTLHDLTVLDLRNAGLYGEIPSDLCGSGSSLSVLQLDGNSLSGPIPGSIGKCSSLYLLSLGHNGLTGPIPAGVSELKKLEILRLEYNNLSGEIPAQLATLDNLLAVNISHNRLVGRLPSSGVFQSLDATALEGNLGICSPLVSEPCRMNVPKPLVLDPNEYNTHGGGTDNNNNNNGDNNLETTANGGVPRKRRVLSVSAMVAVCAAVVIVVGVGVITLLNMSAARRHKELPTEKDKGEKNRSTKEELESGGGVSNNYSGSSSSSTTKTKTKNKLNSSSGKVVTFGAAGRLRSEELLAGDALLSQAAEIGRGSFGTVYRANVGQGRVVAVKKLVSSNSSNKLEFEREVRVLGKAKHPNLMPLKGYYWTPHLQLLITDYAPHGSLEARLHGSGSSSSSQSPPMVMTWAERFRVVSGTARALAHLHQAFRPPMIHYNLKPSNILLDDHCNPMVADFGLPRLLLPKPAVDNQHHSRFHFHQGRGGGTAGGYVAPELACQSLRVNEKCDIYGFGVLILELVTGRRAVEYGDDDVVILIDQVRVMLDHNGGTNVLDCVDPRMGDFPEEEVLPVLKLGMVCTSQIPSNRPSMAEVVQILQVIKAPVG